MVAVEHGPVHARGRPRGRLGVVGMGTTGDSPWVVAFLFSWATATFPGEWQEDNWPGWRLFPTTDEAGQRIKVSLHDWVFNSQVDPNGRRGLLILTRSSCAALAYMNV